MTASKPADPQKTRQLPYRGFDARVGRPQNGCIATDETRSSERGASTAPPSLYGAQAAAWAGLVALRIAGFWLLVAAPTLDVEWENHPAHFWLVLGAAVISAALAYVTGDAA